MKGGCFGKGREIVRRDGGTRGADIKIYYVCICVYLKIICLYNHTFKNYIYENAIVKTTILDKEHKLKTRRVFLVFLANVMDIQSE